VPLRQAASGSRIDAGLAELRPREALDPLELTCDLRRGRTGGLGQADDEDDAPLGGQGQRAAGCPRHRDRPCAEKVETLTERGLARL
jgi:hypothetical protein